MGSTICPNHLWMCRKSAFVITRYSRWHSVNGSTSCRRISVDLSLSSHRIEILSKLLFGSPNTSSYFNFIDTSSVDCNPFFPGKYPKNNIQTDFLSMPIAEFIVYTIVRPYNMMLVNQFHETCFVSCGKRFAIGQFIHLSPVRRRVLVSVKVWRKLETAMHILAHERCAYSGNRSVSRCARKYGMDTGHTAYWSMTKHLDIIEPHVSLLCAPRSRSNAIRAGK